MNLELGCSISNGRRDEAEEDGRGTLLDDRSIHSKAADRCFARFVSGIEGFR